MLLFLLYYILLSLLDNLFLKLFPKCILSHLLKQHVWNIVFFYFYKFIYCIYLFLFLAALGLCCCTRAFSSCGEQGLLFVAMRGLLIAVTSLVVEHGLQARGLSSCGTRALLLRGMWDLPGPGLEPVSPALAGGFLTIHCATREALEYSFTCIFKLRFMIININHGIPEFYKSTVCNILPLIIAPHCQVLFFF